MTKKGFTLLELLAVILLLGIIALIAIPIVSNVLGDAKKGAFETTLSNIDKQVGEACNLEKLNGKAITDTYTITNGVISPDVKIKGDLPDGDITVDSSCNLTYTLTSKYFKAKKTEPKGSPVIEKIGK